mmetsp:Transcript_15054/g.34720  ORF Transcript_15054/g.34720 Transcript_15054/m.34720 type:complete len:100 (-) Transcript_15054:258-557(-)
MYRQANRCTDRSDDKRFAMTATTPVQMTIYALNVPTAIARMPCYDARLNQCITSGTIQSNEPTASIGSNTARNTVQTSTVIPSTKRTTTPDTTNSTLFA